MGKPGDGMYTGREMPKSLQPKNRGKFRLIEKLPPRVPYLRAARAEQPSLEREVEIRILRGGSFGERRSRARV